ELKRIHYHLSKKPAPEGFDAFARALQADIPRLSDPQIVVRLMRLAAMAGDGHTAVQSRSYFRGPPPALPVEFYLFPEGPFIPPAAPGHKELAGLQVVRFGDHPVDKVRSALEPIISRDNRIWLDAIGPALMRSPLILNGLGLIPDSKKVTLTLRDD